MKLVFATYLRVCHKLQQKEVVTSRCQRSKISRLTKNRKHHIKKKFALFYTCQLFLRYKREIFILGVLGFLQTTRSFPKIPEEVQSLLKKSEVFRRRQKSAEGEVTEKTLIHKITDREEGIVICSFIHMVFVPYMGLS